jgi:hypothetical protein
MVNNSLCIVISTKRSAWRDLYCIRGDLSTTLEMTFGLGEGWGALCPSPCGLIVGYVVIIAATTAGITTA